MQEKDSKETGGGADQRLADRLEREEVGTTEGKLRRFLGAGQRAQAAVDDLGCGGSRSTQYLGDDVMEKWYADRVTREEWKQALILAAVVKRLGGRVELTEVELAELESQRVVVYQGDPRKHTIVVEVAGIMEVEAEPVEDDRPCQELIPTAGGIPTATDICGAPVGLHRLGGQLDHEPKP